MILPEWRHKNPTFPVLDKSCSETFYERVKSEQTQIQNKTWMVINWQRDLNWFSSLWFFKSKIHFGGAK